MNTTCTTWSKVGHKDHVSCAHAFPVTVLNIISYITPLRMFNKSPIAVEHLNCWSQSAITFQSRTWNNLRNKTYYNNQQYWEGVRPTPVNRVITVIPECELKIVPLTTMNNFIGCPWMPQITGGSPPPLKPNKRDAINCLLWSQKKQNKWNDSPSHLNAASN